MKNLYKITTIKTNKITIKDVAKDIGVSASAVSMAFSGTGNISQKTRKLILDYCKEVGFIPSIQAQTVKKKSIRFAYIISANPKFVQDKYVEGLKQACTESGSTHLECDIYEYETTNEHLEVALTKCIEQDYDGIIIAIDITAEKRHRKLIEKINQKNIPIVAISTIHDALKADYTVLNDAKKIGALAADILHMRGCNEAILMRGTVGSAIHDCYTEGFICELQRLNVKLISTWLTEDNPELISSHTKHLLPTVGSNTGIFLSNCHCSSAAEIFKEAALNPPFVCLDLFKETEELFEEGRLTATICQHQTKQGYIAAQKLIEMILTANRPKTPQKIIIGAEIITRGSLLNFEY